MEEIIQKGKKSAGKTDLWQFMPYYGIGFLIRKVYSYEIYAVGYKKSEPFYHDLNYQ